MMKIVMKEPSSPEAVIGRRCLLCGEALDPGIEANRRRPCQPARSLARVPGSPSAKPQEAEVERPGKEKRA